MTNRIKWDNALESHDAPWNQDESLFTCTVCDQDESTTELSDHRSEEHEAPVCYGCARQIEAREEFDAATTWTPEEPPRDGWYWAKADGKRLLVYVDAKLGRRNRYSQRDGRMAYPIRIPADAEFWPIPVIAPGLDEEVSK